MDPSGPVWAMMAVRFNDLFRVSPLHQPPMEVGAAVFFLLLLAVNQGDVPRQ